MVIGRGSIYRVDFSPGKGEANLPKKCFINVTHIKSVDKKKYQRENWNPLQQENGGSSSWLKTCYEHSLIISINAAKYF